MIPEGYQKEIMSYAEQLTGDIGTQLEQLGHKAKGIAVLGAPSFSIADEVKANPPDLMLMRSHSRSGISRFFLGSVSHSVVHHTNCSVLLVR